MGLSGAEVVARLGTLGVTLDRRTLYTYEAGRVLSPDAGVVWGLAQIYGADLEDLLKSLVSSRNSPLKIVDIRPGKLSPAETEDRRLLQLMHRLSPEAWRAVEDFVRFQLSQHPDARRRASKSRR